MKIGINLLVLALIWSGALNAQANYKIESGEMTIAGTSTIHDWESTVNEVQIEGNFVLEDQQLLDIQGLTVTIPVLSIVSGRGNIMDKKTWNALRSEEYPNITYSLNEVSKVERTDAGQLLLLNGVVHIAGIDQIIDLEVKGKALEDGKMEFSGDKLLNMADFNIVPPKALFGTLQTGEEITVSFKVIMSKAAVVE